jgi:hypothetical protein
MRGIYDSTLPSAIRAAAKKSLRENLKAIKGRTLAPFSINRNALSPLDFNKDRRSRGKEGNGAKTE